MFGEVGIEGGTALDPGAVVVDDFFESLETAIVHIRGGKLYIAKGRDGEFPAVCVVLGDAVAPKVDRIQPVVGKGLTLKQGTAVAMETVGAKLFAARVVF